MKKVVLVIIPLLLICLVRIISESIIFRNISISEPLGYYLAIPKWNLKRGDLVLTCITNKAYKHIFNELGMKDITGQCNNGMSFLLKKIAAVKGDKVQISSSGVLINNSIILNSKQFHEGGGVNLHPLPAGYIHVMQDNEYFMLGQSLHSLDSRYFGVVTKKDIYAKAVLVYKPN